MITSSKELREWLDFEKCQYGLLSDMKTWIKYLTGNESAVIWHFQKRLRLTEYYYNSGRRMQYYYSIVLLNRLRNKYCLNIPLNTCAKGLKIMHLGPILINKNSRIGENCALHINTALVAKGVSNEAPILESGVVVGIGAVILGNVHVAANVAIGANSVVTHDMEEDNVAVAGVPAVKVSDNGRLFWNKKSQV